jgi:thiol-disulfide isomerase/thioredoxin
MWRYLLPGAVFALLVAVFAVGLFRDPGYVPSPLIGKPAPEFSLPRLDDPQKKLQRSDLLGKVSLVNIWATWCTGCRQEHETLLALARDGSVPIFGINWKGRRGSGPPVAATARQSLCCRRRGRGGWNSDRLGCLRCARNLPDRCGRCCALQTHRTDDACRLARRVHAAYCRSPLGIRAPVRRINSLFAVLLFVAALPAWAIAPEEMLADPAQQAAYEHLTNEVRCLVCQNQTIADSTAPLAVDLRREIRRMLEAGQSEEEIKTFLLDRYGRFRAVPATLADQYSAAVAGAGSVAVDRRHRLVANSPAAYQPADTTR